MDSYYAISAVLESHARLELEDFILRLCEYTPDVVIERNSNPEAVYAMSWSGGNGSLSFFQGRFRRDGQLLRMQGPIEDAASFSVWLRKQYPGIAEWAFWTDTGEFVLRLANRSQHELLECSLMHKREFGDA